MYVGKTLFAQVMEFVPWTSFTRIVQRHGGDSGVRALSCAEQFRAMAFRAAHVAREQPPHEAEVDDAVDLRVLPAAGFFGRYGHGCDAGGRWARSLSAIHIGNTLPVSLRNVCLHLQFEQR